MSTTTRLQKKSLNSPDEVRTFEKGKIEIGNIGDVSIGRSTFEPGWSWEAPHTGYIVSGRIKVVMDDGTEGEAGPGDIAVIPPGHNAWVVGNEPCVMIDFTGAKDYAKNR